VQAARSPKLQTTKHILQLEDAITISSPKINELHNNPPTNEKENQQWEVPLHWEENPAWEAMGPFNLKEEPHWNGGDIKMASSWKDFLLDGVFYNDNAKSKETSKSDEIDSWFNDDLITGSETLYSSDEVDSRRSSFGSTIDQIRAILPRILVTRDMLEKWLQDPQFNRGIQGCFVRISINNENSFIKRVDQIVDNCFHPYTVNHIQTTKGIALTVNNCRHLFRIDEVSNYSPTLQEFNFWQEEAEKGVFPLDFDEISEKIEMIRVLSVKYPEFLLREPVLLME